MLSLKSYFGICLLIYIDQLVKTATSQLLSKSCEYTGSILKIEDHILNTQVDNLINRVLANQGALLLFRNKYMSYSMKKNFFFQFPAASNMLKHYPSTGSVVQTQRCIENPVKHLRWSVL